MLMGVIRNGAGVTLQFVNVTRVTRAGENHVQRMVRATLNFLGQRQH